jgi:hypothetical protein
MILIGFSGYSAWALKMHIAVIPIINILSVLTEISIENQIQPKVATRFNPTLKPLLKSEFKFVSSNLILLF